MIAGADLEQGFYSAFYLNRFRCGPCHFSNFDEIDEAPKWVEVGVQHRLAHD